MKNTYKKTTDALWDFLQGRSNKSPLSVWQEDTNELPLPKVAKQFRDKPEDEFFIDGSTYEDHVKA